TVAVNAARPLHQRRQDFALVGPVGQVREVRGDAAEGVQVGQDLVLQRHALFLDPGRFGAQHEPREVYLPPVWRDVGARRGAQLALVTPIDNLTHGLARQPGRLAVDFVDAVEEHVKRGAEVIAATATVADVEDAGEFLPDLTRVPESRRVDVEIKAHMLFSFLPDAAGRDAA